MASLSSADSLLTADQIIEKYKVKLTKEEKVITVLNVSKCSIPELKEELERRGVYDEDDEKIWKRFKDLETKIWVEGYNEQKAKEKEVVENDEEASAPKKTFPLTFQDIERWSMYELRQEMEKRNLLEEAEWTAAYKMFEEMLAKVVRELLKGDSNVEKKEKKDEKKVVSPSELGEEWIADNVKKTKTVPDAASGKHLLAGQPVGDNLNRSTVNIDKLAKDQVPNIEDVTVDNAPKLNIYQIRQLLERNDLFGDYKSGKKKISFESCLRTLVAYIVDKREKQNVVYATTLEPETDLKERLAKEKAERKAKAIERSRLRQIARKEAEAKAKAEEAEKAKVEGDASVARTLLKKQKIRAAIDLQSNPLFVVVKCVSILDVNRIHLMILKTTKNYS